IGPARPQIHFRRNDFEAFWAPPVFHTLWIGEAFPDQVARRIERARDHKVFDHCVVPSFPQTRRYLGSTMIIQFTPNLSASIPKRGEKKVLVIGIVTLPSDDRALNRRSASVSSLASSESAKPLKSGWPLFSPSDAMTRVFPIVREACITLFSLFGVHIDFSGLSFQRISMPTWAPTAFL